MAKIEEIRQRRLAELNELKRLSHQNAEAAHEVDLRVIEDTYKIEAKGIKSEVEQDLKERRENAIPIDNEDPVAQQEGRCGPFSGSTKTRRLFLIILPVWSLTHIGMEYLDHVICGNKLGQEKAVLDEAMFDLTSNNKKKRPRTESAAGSEAAEANKTIKSARSRSASIIDDEDEEDETAYRDIVDIFQERLVRSYLPSTNRSLQKKRGRKPGPGRPRSYSTQTAN